MINCRIMFDNHRSSLRQQLFQLSYFFCTDKYKYANGNLLAHRLLIDNFVCVIVGLSA